MPALAVDAPTTPPPKANRTAANARKDFVGDPPSCQVSRYVRVAPWVLKARASGAEWAKGSPDDCRMMSEVGPTRGSVIENPVAGADYLGRLEYLRAWFTTDADCLDYLDWLRWPGEFVCPWCGTARGAALGGSGGCR
jgi:hypothetical protein